jgi:hypothetical protein
VLAEAQGRKAALQQQWAMLEPKLRADPQRYPPGAPVDACGLLHVHVV